MKNFTLLLKCTKGVLFMYAYIKGFVRDIENDYIVIDNNI